MGNPEPWKLVWAGGGSPVPHSRWAEDCSNCQALVRNSVPSWCFRRLIPTELAGNNENNSQHPALQCQSQKGLEACALCSGCPGDASCSGCVLAFQAVSWKALLLGWEANLENCEFCVLLWEPSNLHLLFPSWSTGFNNFNIAIILRVDLIASICKKQCNSNSIQVN